MAPRLHLLGSFAAAPSRWRTSTSSNARVSRSGARSLEGPVAEILGALVDHPLVSEVRTGPALLAAVQIDPALVEADPSLPGRAAMACRSVGGTITRALAGGGLQVSPALIITEEQLRELATGLRAGLDAVAETT